jgi:twitching motility protein PilT
VIDIEHALRALVANDGSDLHLKVGSVPTARVHGELVPLEADAAPLSRADTESVVRALLAGSDRVGEFEQRREIELSHFPAHHHQLVRSTLAGTLRGVISQRLVPGADGGRVAACEVLCMTGRVREMILDHTQTGLLGSVIAEGEYYGMQTFDQALHAHVQAGRVTVDDAMAAATNRSDLKLMLDTAGRRGTTMADVPIAEEAEAA